MESELLIAVNYIKNISKEKVTFAKIEAFMRKKELFTCKEDLDNIIDSFIENGLIKSGAMEKIQLSKLPTKSTVLKYLHQLKVLTAKKTLKKKTHTAK